ncbi:MAG: hypothetical protein LBC93_02000, partial [Synergistaceae bacterium]|nr:hypothetical protein [Synergistaceae bacterium]
MSKILGWAKENKELIHEKMKKMTFNQEKIYKWIAGTGIFLMCVSLFLTTKLAHMNSDNAWYAIAGRGIAEGNILLSNFVGNTLSQYFTYIAIEAFWSLFVHNYRDVHALSIVTLVALLGGVLFFAIKGLLGKKVRLFSVLTLIAIVITIHPGTLSDTFAHTAPLLCTLSAACLYYTKRDEQWAKYGIVTLLACWIDDYNTAYFLAPIIVENILYYVKTKKMDPMLKWVAFGIIAYIIRHMALKDVGIMVPGAGAIIKSALAATHFADISNRFSQVYLSFANLFSAGFWGLRIEKALWNLYFAIAMFFALYLQYRYLIEIFKRKSNDENRFMTFLLLGSIFILGLQLFSQMHIVPRYLSGLFVNSLVILGYWLN